MSTTAPILSLALNGRRMPLPRSGARADVLARVEATVERAAGGARRVVVRIEGGPADYMRGMWLAERGLTVAPEPLSPSAAGRALADQIDAALPEDGAPTAEELDAWRVRVLPAKKT